MIKLYKKEGDKLLYAESWVDENIATVHTGTAGETGECYEEDCQNAKLYLKAFKEKYEKLGYGAIPDNDMYWITVKWETFSQTPDEAEEERIARVYDELNEAFGWLGLGYADGFDVTEENGRFYICVYALSVDKDLGRETAQNCVPLENGFTVECSKFL